MYKISQKGLKIIIKFRRNKEKSQDFADCRLFYSHFFLQVDDAFAEFKVDGGMIDAAHLKGLMCSK